MTLADMEAKATQIATTTKSAKAKIAHDCYCKQVHEQHPEVEPCGRTTYRTWASGCDGRVMGILVRLARRGKLTTAPTPAE